MIRLEWPKKRGKVLNSRRISKTGQLWSVEKVSELLWNLKTNQVFIGDIFEREAFTLTEAIHLRGWQYWLFLWAVGEVRWDEQCWITESSQLSIWSRNMSFSARGSIPQEGAQESNERRNTRVKRAVRISSIVAQEVSFQGKCALFLPF